VLSSQVLGGAFCALPNVCRGLNLPLVASVHVQGIHTCSAVNCDDKYNQKKTSDDVNYKPVIDCDTSVDWTNLREDELPSFKYWEADRSSQCETTDQLDNKTMSDDADMHTHCNSKDEIIQSNNSKSDSSLTHTDSHGRLNMVDIGDKSDSARVAIATGRVILGEKVFDLVKDNNMKKGDVLTVAKIAGINGAKKCSDLIPLCHNIPISKVDLRLDLIEDTHAIKITSLVKTYGRTGVEMEAITAVAIAAITVYDMCKAVTKDMVISEIKLVHKSGGKSGEYNLSEE